MKRHKRRRESSARTFRPRPPKHNDRDANNDKGGKRSDIHELCDLANGEEARHKRRERANDQRWPMRRMKAWMRLSEPCGQQSVAAHRKPDARAAQHEGKHDAGDAGDSGGRHDERRPGKADCEAKAVATGAGLFNDW